MVNTFRYLILCKCNFTKQCNKCDSYITAIKYCHLIVIFFFISISFCYSNRIKKLCLDLYCKNPHVLDPLRNFIKLPSHKTIRYVCNLVHKSNIAIYTPGLKKVFFKIWRLKFSENKVIYLSWYKLIILAK